MAGAPLRIAHSFGNSRHLADSALKSPVDMIEADVRLRHGRLRLEHDWRVSILPVYVGRRSQEPPTRWLVRFGQWQARLRVNAPPLEDLLQKAGRCRLLLDLKQTRRSEDVTEFVRILAGWLHRFDRAAYDCLCGDWSHLDVARRLLPETRLYYSVGDGGGWQALVERLDRGDPITGVSLRSTLFDGSSAGLLQSKGIETFCWCVDDAAEAVRVTMLGAAGIISNDLALLAKMSEACSSG